MGGGWGESASEASRAIDWLASLAPIFFAASHVSCLFPHCRAWFQAILALLSKRFRAQTERLEWAEGESAWYTSRHLTKVATKAFWLLIIKYCKIKLSIILALCVFFSKQIFCCGPSTLIVTPYSLPLCWTTFPRKNLLNTLSNFYTGICFLITLIKFLFKEDIKIIHKACILLGVNRTKELKQLVKD